MEANSNIIFLNIPGFPHLYSAYSVKCSLMGKTLTEATATVYFINNAPFFAYDSPQKNMPQGKVEGINYLYTCGTSHKNKSRIINWYLRIKGLYKEYVFLWKHAKKNTTLIIAYCPFLLLLAYKILCMLRGIHLVLSIMELHIAMEKRPLRKKINDRLFDRYAFMVTDKVIVISDYLKNYIHQLYPQKKIYKIPVLADASLFDAVTVKDTEKYFLFCGNAYYASIIEFIVSAFEKLQTTEYKLVLICQGTSQQMQALKEKLKQSPSYAHIALYSHLPYEELIRYYKKSFALLIPLRPSIQDTARFPQKIAEYLASGRPVITTNVGEIKNYLSDGMNAFIAHDYDSYAFAEKMQQALDNPQQAHSIGLNGRKVFDRFFDYRLYGQSLLEFLSS